MNYLVNSYDTEIEAIETAQEIKYVHERAGLMLRGWNSQRVLVTIPKELRTSEPTHLVFDYHRQEKTLELKWLHVEDKPTFNGTINRVPTQVCHQNRVPTKREALRAVVSSFDPLGLSHFAKTVKILLQKLWHLQIGWDEPIPTNLIEDFCARFKNKEELKQPRLTRHYNTRGARSVDLHLSDEECLLRHSKTRISESDLKNGPSGQHELAMRHTLVRYAAKKTQSELVVIDATKNRGSLRYKEDIVEELVNVAREHCALALINDERPVNVVQQKCWIMQRTKRKRVALKCFTSYARIAKRSAAGQLHGNPCEAVDCRSDPCDPVACTGHYVKADESCIPTSTQRQIQKNTLEDFDMRRTNQNLRRRVSSNNQEARRPNEQ